MMYLNFGDNNHNVFFGGDDGASRFYLKRNATAGKIDLEMLDDQGNSRDYTFDSPLVVGNWYQLILHGTAGGADGIDLYVNGVVQNVSAQTNDVGFTPNASLGMNWGDVDGVNMGAFKLAKPYFYVSALEANEIADVWALKKYPDFPNAPFYAWNFKRPNIGLNKAITIE